MSFEIFQMIFLVALALAVLLPMPACWRLCRRAELPGWASLLILIPIVNVATVYWFAFVTGARESPRRSSIPGECADAANSTSIRPRNRRHVAGAGGRHRTIAGARR